MAKKTVNEILRIMVREIGAYKGAAVERAVYGVRGALHALEAIGKLSEKKSIEWDKKAMEAGIRQGWDPGRAPVGDLDAQYWNATHSSEQG